LLCRRSGAFTLIELLVVIVVIAVLAAIALPVFGMVQKSGYRTKCASNLRQVGTGIASYSGDHDGYLPGPLWEFQSCWYHDGDYGTLATLLAPYWGLALDSEKRKAEVMVCPAWQKRAPYAEDSLFVVNTSVKLGDSVVNPWGDGDLLDSEGETSSNSDAVHAKKLVALTDAGLPRTWAMQDLDSLTPLPNVPKGIAPEPVHGDIRNTLYFDFHIEPMRVGSKLKP
jgi:prepilin-type N-terminal cleavage/methylation domain-containing protein